MMPEPTAERSGRRGPLGPPKKRLNIGSLNSGLSAETSTFDFTAMPTTAGTTLSTSGAKLGMPSRIGTVAVLGTLALMDGAANVSANPAAMAGRIREEPAIMDIT